MVDTALFAKEITALLAAAVGFGGVLRLAWTCDGNRIALLESMPNIPESFSVMTVRYQSNILLNQVSHSSQIDQIKLAKTPGPIT